MQSNIKVSHSGFCEQLVQKSNFYTKGLSQEKNKHDGCLLNLRAISGNASSLILFSQSSFIFSLKTFA